MQCGLGLVCAAAFLRRHSIVILLVEKFHRYQPQVRQVWVIFKQHRVLTSLLPDLESSKQKQILILFPGTMGNQYYKPGDEKVDVSVGDEEQRNLSRRSTAASDGFAPDMGMPGRHRLRDSRRSPRDRITGSEIRLLKLRPGKPGEDLEGNIEVFSLLRSPGKVEKGSVKDADDGTGCVHAAPSQLLPERPGNQVS